MSIMAKTKSLLQQYMIYIPYIRRIGKRRCLDSVVLGFNTYKKGFRVKIEANYPIRFGGGCVQDAAVQLAGSFTPEPSNLVWTGPDA